jgi:hypothetical protein
MQNRLKDPIDLDATRLPGFEKSKREQVEVTAPLVTKEGVLLFSRRVMLRCAAKHVFARKDPHVLHPLS